MSNALFEDGNRFDFVKVVKRLELRIFAPQNPPLDPIREELLELVAYVPSGWHTEYVVKFLVHSVSQINHRTDMNIYLERALFCLCSLGYIVNATS